MDTLIDALKPEVWKESTTEDRGDGQYLLVHHAIELGTVQYLSECRAGAKFCILGT